MQCYSIRLRSQSFYNSSYYYDIILIINKDLNILIEQNCKVYMYSVLEELHVRNEVNKNKFNTYYIKCTNRILKIIFFIKFSVYDRNYGNRLLLKLYIYNITLQLNNYLPMKKKKRYNSVSILIFNNIYYIRE